MMTIFTIGHGTRTTDELVGVLEAHTVGVVVDVRRYPGSRRHPHFGRGALERDLPAAGIAYEWWGEELGGRRRRAAETRHPAWRVDAFRAYADYADSDEFRAALDRLEQLASRRAVSVMCSERLWWRCHRRLIADHLTVRAWHVVHIIDESSSQPHRLHEGLRTDAEGRPVYDVGETGSLL